MLIPLFTIRDVQADAFGKIFMFQNENMAKRTFHQALLNPNDQMSTFPADYVLYGIGVYDDQSGVIESQHPIRICTGTEILSSRQEDMVKIEALKEEIRALNGEGHA